MDRHETLVYGGLGDVEELVEEGNVVGFSTHSLHHGELDDDNLRIGSVVGTVHHDEGIGVTHHLQSHHHLPHHEHDAHDPLRVGLNHDHHDLLNHNHDLPLSKRGHEEITEADLLGQAKKYKLDTILTSEAKERALLIRIQLLEEEVSKWKEMYEEERARRLEEQHHEHDHVYGHHVSTNPPIVFPGSSIDHDHQDGHHDDSHDHHHHHHLDQLEAETDSDEQPQPRQVTRRSTAKKKKPKEIPDTSSSSEDELTEDQLKPLNIDNGTEDQWIQRYSELEALVIKKRRWPRLDGYHHPLLFHWINKQVEKKERNQLQEKYINLLNKLLFDWKKRRTVVPWEDHYKKLEIVKMTTGGFSLHNTKYRSNQTFFYWIRNQKREIKRGVVPPDRYEKLKELGFVDHVFGSIHHNPEDELGEGQNVGEDLKTTFSEIDGLTTHIDMHQIDSHSINNNHNINNNNHNINNNNHNINNNHNNNNNNNNNSSNNNNTTTSHKFTKQQLDKESWRYFVSKLGEFKSKFGHTNPPFFNNEYHDLAGWVHYVRSERKKNKKVSENLIRCLDELGFDWHKESTPAKKPSKKPDKKPSKP